MSADLFCNQTVTKDSRKSCNYRHYIYLGIEEEIDYHGIHMILLMFVLIVENCVGRIYFATGPWRRIPVKVATIDVIFI